MPPRPTRRLGPLTVDIACLGTMTMGRQCAADEAWRQLDAYVADSSAPWIDCAEVYPVPQRADDMGKTEEIIGEWLASKPAGFRERIVLATKVAGPSSGRGALAARERALGGGAAPTAPTVEQRHVPDQIRRALQASLKRLRTTYVDLYILHWPDRAVPLWGASNFTEDMSKGAYGMRPKDAPREPLWDKFEDVVRVMGELVGEGKIRAWGLSNETPVGVTLFCETAKRLGLPAPVSIQQDFSLCDRRFETTLLEACSRYGVQLHAYGPLCGGTLTGKYHQAPESDGAGAGAGTGAGDADAAKRARAGARHVAHGDFQPRYHAAPTMEASLKYFRLAQTLGMTETQLALGWCATRWYMGGVVLGANTVEQLQEDLEAVTNAPARITKAVEEQVDAIHVQRMNPNVTL